MSYFFGGFAGVYYVEALCGIMNDELRAAMLLQIVFLYNHRGDSMSDVSDLCPEAQSIMSKYRSTW
jgi:hypothetical protein